MKTKFSAAAVLIGLVWAGSVFGQSSLLYSQLSDGQSTFGPSELWTPASVNSEVADDFDVIGNIDRVYAGGFIWGAVDFQGLYVRFYEYKSDGTPGLLQREYFFASADPSVQFDQLSGAIEVTLSSPFAATGKHFLSVQPVINYWYWWSSQTNAPRGQAFYFRNNAIGGAWHHGDDLNIGTNADVVFALYGTPTGAGTISNLSATTLERSGYLEIFGSNFGGGGQVLIGGISAPVGTWMDGRIVAYVPEAAPLSNVSVQVINASGIASNTANFNVVARQSPNGRVNWRFRMNGPYSEVRPVVANDDTVYSIDAFGHLYALQPNGGLKWLVRGAGDKGLALGTDGSVYVASESFIKAFSPDGSEKWTFTQDPRAMINLGVAVGPDGNVYSVGTEGMGVFSLTPAGALRWTNPEFYARPIVDYGEIVFGPSGSQQQLYFHANNHLRALTLDGSPVFTITDSLPANLRDGQQPAVAPDGSVHTMLTAFSPSGSALWSFATPYPLNVFTPPNIGSNGIHYFVQNLMQLFALNPDGSRKWQRTMNGVVAGAIVDPTNRQLVMGSSETGDHAGFIIGASASDGSELWRVTLPIEDPTVFNSSVGIFGFNQFVTTRARFTPDGSTAYLLTATATGDNNTSKSFVYSLNAAVAVPTPAPSATPTPTGSLRSTSISLSAKVAKSTVTVTSAVTVRSMNGAAVSGATVSATWTLPGGSTQTQSATTNSNGTASFSVKSIRGTYTFTETNIAKSGYTFDSANSVLTKSITK